MTPSVNPCKSTPAVDDLANLVELLATGRFEPNILPYTVAIDEMLGAPMRDVSVAVQAARVDEAQLCLAYYPFEVTEQTWRLFPGMSPVPSGYADTIIKRLAATRQPDGQPDGQAGLPEAAASCWQRAVEEVVDPATTLAALLPSATPDAELAAVAEQRYTECLAALGYVVDPSVPIDQAFFDQSIAIERSVNDGTITREEALTQLDEVKAAEEADAAVRAPCDVELEGQTVGLVAVEQQAVLDANPGLLQPSAALVAAMAELQPYLDAIAD